MATIADNIAELMRIKLEQRDFFGIAEDVPFADYIDIIKWTGQEVPQQPMYADFVNHRYALNGKPCSFQDIFEFIRLSKAWDFTESGLKEYGIDEPRISSKGLLIEPESTNFLRDSFMTEGVNGFDIKGGDLEFGEDDIGSYIKFIKSAADNYAYKKYMVTDPDAKDGDYRISFLSDSSSLRFSSGANADLQSVGILLRSSVDEKDKVYSVYANVNEPGQNGNSRGFVKRPHHSEVEPKIYAIQMENHPFSTSFIKTEDSPTTRLPDTLRLLQDGVLTIDADEGIVQTGNEFSGFGYIRKMEIK